ncbi:MAG: hypothetical protein A2Y33_04645 [Spirochaetes bacterium GWF1_51_8]|nr:MAG: hypothetical protein A2Y33_04645 [Spirochaetes bacterium GWF1_51_8]
MKISYDPTNNIAYLQIRDKNEEVESLKISDELTIDLSPDGRVFGIELLNANDQLGISAKIPFVFINEKSHEKKELSLNP